MAWNGNSDLESEERARNLDLSNCEEDSSAMGAYTDKTPLLGYPSNMSDKEARKFPQYIGALCACLSAMSVGSTMGWTNAAEQPLSQDKSAKFTVSIEDMSWLSAMLSIGAMVGALPLGILANKIGRQRVIIILAPFMVGGFLLLAWANKLWMLFLGRIITGAVTGAYCVVTPMYTSEISEDSIRGRLGSFFQLMITIGILFIYLLNIAGVSLFWVNIACACIPAIMAVAMMFLHESPKWLLSTNHEDKAIAALTFYRGVEYDVESEKRLLLANINNERQNKLPFTQAFSTTAAVRGLFLALTVMLFQQLSGINAVIFNAKQIFDKAHAGIESNLSTVIVGIFQVAFTFLASLLIDWKGRKPLLLLSGAFMALSGFLLGLYFFLLEKNMADSIGWLPILSMIVFIVFFSLGYGPIPWLYMSEVFADQIKESGMAIATITNWVAVFIVTKFYTNLLAGIQEYGTFWLFSAISVLGCVFTYFQVLETKGKSREQIQSELSGISGEILPSSTDASNQKQDVEKNEKY